VLLDGGAVVKIERDKTKGGSCWKTGCDGFNCLLVEDARSKISKFFAWDG
jgi:hypothetical protein